MRLATYSQKHSLILKSLSAIRSSSCLVSSKKRKKTPHVEHFLVAWSDLSRDCFYWF